MLILSYENEISLTCKLNTFSYERMSTKTRFEEEAKGNSEMAYCIRRSFPPRKKKKKGRVIAGLVLNDQQMHTRAIGLFALDFYA